jgi:hypothetical protein
MILVCSQQSHFHSSTIFRVRFLKRSSTSIANNQTRAMGTPQPLTVQRTQACRQQPAATLLRNGTASTPYCSCIQEHHTRFLCTCTPRWHPAILRRSQGKLCTLRCGLRRSHHRRHRHRQLGLQLRVNKSTDVNSPL